MEEIMDDGYPVRHQPLTNRDVFQRCRSPSLTSYSSKISEKIINAFAADGTSRLFLLVDPFLRSFNEYDDLLIFEKIRREEFIRFNIEHKSFDKSKSPLLISLDLEDDNDIEVLKYSVYRSLEECTPEFLSYGYGRRFCGWLFIPENIKDIDGIADFFGQLAIQRILSAKTILLRFYDPAVFVYLWDIFKLFQKAIMMRYVKSWFVLSGNGELMRFGRPSEPPLIGKGMLAITEEQINSINLIGIMNGALRKYRAIDNNIAIDELQAKSLLIDTLNRAKQLNFSSADSLREWAFDALTIHPDFDKHPIMLNRINNVKPGCDYDLLISKLTEVDWNEIKKEYKNREIIKLLEKANKVKEYDYE